MATSEVSTIFSGKENRRRFLIICSNSTIWEFDGVSWYDRTGDPVEDGWGLRWTGGWLTGSLTLANRKAVRTFQGGLDDVSQPMVYNGGVNQPGDETWESKNYSAQVFRPFREYMMAGYPIWDGQEYPSRIQWSHAVEPGQIPVDWVPRDDNDAGDVDLADTPGAVVDMVPLRDSLVILKEDSIYSCNWIGGTGSVGTTRINQVFEFRRLTNNQGVFAPDTAVEYNGFLWAQGIEDIFILDGNLVTSVLWGRIKESWLKDRDETKAQYAFTSLDVINEEVLFFYVSRNAPAEWIYPDKALVLNLKNNAFFYRDYALEVPHAKIALSLRNQTASQLVFYGIDRQNKRLLDLEQTPDRLGAPTPAYFIRSLLFSDPGHDWIQVDKAKLQITGNNANFQLGGQTSIDGAIDWRNAVAFDPTSQYKLDVRHNANMIAVRVDVDTLADWKLANLNLLVQKVGER